MRRSILSYLWRIELTDISVDEFKEMLEDLAKGLTGDDDIADVKKNWILLAKEAGQDQESIVALFQIFYFIRAIFYTWIAVESRKIMEKAVHN
ncbi:MAG: hypothetical protein NTZ42_04315 [Candidatus Gribaldobacteria bacterium]|nr:hypothetical protein [Candidatus Gribaldobacteria bacterium]